MSITEGYLYARPLSEEDWRLVTNMIEPHFLGLIIVPLSYLTRPNTKLEGVNIGNDSEFTQSDIFCSWAKKKWPYSESDFLWKDRKHCKPPLSVAESADRLASNMEARDEDVTWLITVAADRLGWQPEEAAADCIQAMRDLAKACRFVAEKGATEVTVLLQS